MRIGLIGYGSMGQLIERLASEKGHETGVAARAADSVVDPAALAEKLGSFDVVIDFSTAEAVKRNVQACMIAQVPLVEGTTGWNGERGDIEELVRSSDGALVFGANFSLGVNLFYRIVAHAADLFSRIPEYEVFIEEQHHSRKKDAPSGTALKLKQIVEESIDIGFTIASTRAGHIPGTHRVGFDGRADQILLEHTARTRDGFAAGALLAAEWIARKKGFYEFTDVIDQVLQSRK